MGFFWNLTATYTLEIGENWNGFIQEVLFTDYDFNSDVQAGVEKDDCGLIVGPIWNPWKVCEYCGNGMLKPPEVCDDANTVSGDGCDSACSAIEADYECLGGVGGLSLC